MVEIGDHYCSTSGYPASGVYRVVGTGTEVTLLKVATEDGRRVYTGELVHVASTTLEDSFERANDPDARFSPARSVRNVLQGLYWSVRRFF